jgi:drug/metabolite transporter (DMT)-like permease
MSPYELLLIPAAGTYVGATFLARAAGLRGVRSAPLALLAMGTSLLVACGALVAAAGGAPLRKLYLPGMLWVALPGGFAGALGLCCSFMALRQRATGPVSVVSSMSVLVPIGMALALGWDAALGPARVAGALLAVGGLTLINLARGARVEGFRFHWLPLALGAMLAFGISQTAQKYITVLYPDLGPRSRLVFMAVYYAVCTVTLAAYLLCVREGVERRAVPFAAGLALCSFVQFGCMLILLQHVPTARVYITFTGGGNIAVLLVSAGLLKERYSALAWLGCLAGVAGIVLLRL